MPTLILSARQTEDAQLLWRACLAAKWEVVRAQNWQVPEISSGEVAVYGEPLFAQHVAQSLGLRLMEPSVDWLARLPNRWRGREVSLMTLVEARKVPQRAFIKPADEKCFAAKVYSSGAELPAPGPLPEDLAVLVQEVVQWELEFRCFVQNRRVVTLSPYWRNGRLAKDENGWWPASEAELKSAKEFCESVLADESVSVPEVVVMDVGTITGRGWAVVETNAAWASGIYGCEPEKVLGVLKKACAKKG